MTEINLSWGAFYRHAKICENDQDHVLGLLSVKLELCLNVNAYLGVMKGEPAC